MDSAKFSTLNSRPGFCIFSPEFFMAGNWWKMQLFPGGGGMANNASSEGHIQDIYLLRDCP